MQNSWSEASSFSLGQLGKIELDLRSKNGALASFESAMQDLHSGLQIQTKEKEVFKDSNPPRGDIKLASSTHSLENPKGKEAESAFAPIQKLLDGKEYLKAAKMFLVIHVPSAFWNDVGEVSNRIEEKLPFMHPQVQTLQTQLRLYAEQFLRRFAFLPEVSQHSRDQTENDKPSNNWFQKTPSKPRPALVEAVSMVWHLSTQRDEAWTSIVEIFRDDRMECIAPGGYRLGENGRKTTNFSSRLYASNLEGEIAASQIRSLYQNQQITYLQCIGELVLENLVHQLPLLLSLPEKPPAHVIRFLYVEPFAKAIRKAVEACLTVSRFHLSTFSRHALCKTNTQNFKPLCPSNDKWVPHQGEAASKLSIVCVISHMHLDIQDFCRGAEMLYKHSTTSNFSWGFMETFEDHASAIWETLRAELGTRIHTYVVSHVQGMLLRDIEVGALPHGERNLNGDTWPDDAEISKKLCDSYMERPRVVDECVHKVLSFLCMNSNQISKLPPALQVWSEQMNVLNNL